MESCRSTTATTDPHQLGDAVLKPIWLEPYPEALLGAAGPIDPAARYDVRESVEIALVAAVNSALRRARASLNERVHRATQRQTVEALGDERVQKLLDSLVSAWERADVPAILDPAARRGVPTGRPHRTHARGRPDRGVHVVPRADARRAFRVAADFFVTDR